jgi:lipoprotein-anchoring transpeptidase ErfK/SrfK
VRPAVIALLLVLGPSAATASSSGVALTLKGPRATTYGHRVDFAGRLSPSVPGARIRLYRGATLIAGTDLRKDGTYRFNVGLGRPGPFHTVWNGVSSNPIAVRIIPKLVTSLAGARVAGSPLAFRAQLEPKEAGTLRVRVIRGGVETYRGGFEGRARVRLGTHDLEPFEVRADTVPAAGYAAAAKKVRISLRAPALEYGSTSPLVAGLARRLAALGYAAPSSRAVFDTDVLEAVYAFQKAQRLPRTGVADAAFWRRLARPRPILPRYRSPANHLEVDKDRQILLVVRGGQVTLVAPVSTAGIAGYYTPVGRFAIGRKIPGYDPSPLGVLYKPMYFYGGYAIHGNPSVPPYPASHGCVRVPNFVIDRLFETEPYGETVYVYN